MLEFTIRYYNPLDFNLMDALLKEPLELCMQTTCRSTIMHIHMFMVMHIFMIILQVRDSVSKTNKLRGVFLSYNFAWS